MSNLGVGTPEFVNTPEGGSTGDEMELNQTDLQYEKKVGRLYMSLMWADLLMIRVEKKKKKRRKNPNRFYVNYLNYWS